MTASRSSSFVPEPRRAGERPVRLPRPSAAGALVAVLAGSLAVAGCGPVDDLLERLEGATPRERYAASLEEAGLDRTAVGRRWADAGEAAVREAPAVEAPFRESGYFPADDPAAAGWRVPIRRGQVLRVEVRASAGDGDLPRLFLDLFERVAAADSVEFRHLASADTGSLALEREAERDGSFVVRLQPELLRSVRWEVDIVAEASMAFPVSGHGSDAIKSGFGAPREAGRRQHHGVDIFAPRGTPVVAATAGEVSRVGTNRLGGNIVWLRDRRRPQGLYYAHLDTQLVRRGAQVRPGDTLGLVGNSGNARTTPPHLHFGIYRRDAGPVDPYPFIHRPPTGPPEIAADTTALGGWVRLATRARVRASPSLEADTLGTFEVHTVGRGRGVAGEWVRILLPDGREGWVHHELVEPAAPLRRLDAETVRVLVEAPRPGALVVDSLASEARPAVLGSFADFLLVEEPAGRVAWTPGRSG